MPGGGINADNVARRVQDTGVREIHFSVKDAQKVRDVLESL
jgi:copper homeostasis protein CutC